MSKILEAQKSFRELPLGTQQKLVVGGFFGSLTALIVIYVIWRILFTSLTDPAKEKINILTLLPPMAQERVIQFIRNPPTGLPSSAYENIRLFKKRWGY